MMDFNMTVCYIFIFITKWLRNEKAVFWFDKIFLSQYRNVHNTTLPQKGAWHEKNIGFT